ncbi:MAG: hypothetical protein ACLTQI_07190 [Slackia sp.]
MTTLDTIVGEGLVPAVADNAGIFIFLVAWQYLVAWSTQPAAPRRSAAGQAAM